MMIALSLDKIASTKETIDKKLYKVLYFSFKKDVEKRKRVNTIKKTPNRSFRPLIYVTLSTLNGCTDTRREVKKATGRLD